VITRARDTRTNETTKESDRYLSTTHPLVGNAAGAEARIVRRRAGCAGLGRSAGRPAGRPAGLDGHHANAAWAPRRRSAAAKPSDLAVGSMTRRIEEAVLTPTHFAKNISAFISRGERPADRTAESARSSSDAAGLKAGWLSRDRCRWGRAYR